MLVDPSGFTRIHQLQHRTDYYVSNFFSMAPMVQGQTVKYKYSIDADPLEQSKRDISVLEW